MEPKLTLTDDQAYNLLNLFYPRGIAYWPHAWPVLLKWGLNNRIEVLRDVVHNNGEILEDEDDDDDSSETEYYDNVIAPQIGYL